MKHKYSINANDKSNELVIKEYGELDKEILSLLCEETYALDGIIDAAKLGKLSLISKLRTPNLYPPNNYIDRIADTVMEMAIGESPEGEPQELHFDDLEQLSRDEAAMLVGDIDDDSDDIDELLDDDDGTDEKIKSKAINTSIKVADDIADGGEG
jgi:hypothetical protein